MQQHWTLVELCSKLDQRPCHTRDVEETDEMVVQFMDKKADQTLNQLGHHSCC